MSTYLPARFSRPVALLATLAMVGGLLVITPTPGKAADPKPDYLPTFDACPEDVIPEANFSDVSPRHPNVGDVNCIAYYGITRGTGNNRYSPDRPVIREHMALFLIRMARLVGISLPTPSLTAFTDIVNLSEESRLAISQLAQLGITIGTGDNMYSPARNVSRGEMALFLSRLMDLIDVPEYRGRVFGYLPDDVDERVLDDADVDAPYTDMRERTVAEFDAVEQLYELGVASGVSSRAYGPARDMSRSHMAEFMAAILDHSNLRPRGVTVQLTPTLGWEDYSITAMISARDIDFNPQDNTRVDWFYTDNPEGGLQSNGECDLDLIIEGDCVWDDDRDDLTDDDGNYYEELRAVSGEVLTFYAWIGERDEEEFDEDSRRHGRAEARSDKGPERFLITHNIPEHAARVTHESPDLNDAYVVARDVQRSIRLTIQLEDEDGRILEREGLEIKVQVAEWSANIKTRTDGDSKPLVFIIGTRPRPDDEDPLFTNQRGEATFELTRPRDEGVTVVTFTSEEESDEGTFEVIWSTDTPVVFSAKPSFDLYQNRQSNRISFFVDYYLYDQYGNLLNRRNSNVGRDNENMLAHTLSYSVHSVAKEEGTVALAGSTDNPLDMMINGNGRIRFELKTTDDLNNFDYSNESDYFVVITPAIETQTSNTNKSPVAKYAKPVVVWIVRDAEDEDDKDIYNSDYQNALKVGLDAIPALDMAKEKEEFQKISIDTGRDEFRTFFTSWEYDSNDEFSDGEDNDLTITRFEDLIRADIEIEDLDIRFYSSNSARTSYFTVTR